MVLKQARKCMEGMILLLFKAKWYKSEKCDLRLKVNCKSGCLWYIHYVTNLDKPNTMVSWIKRLKL